MRRKLIAFFIYHFIFFSVASLIVPFLSFWLKKNLFTHTIRLLIFSPLEVKFNLSIFSIALLTYFNTLIWFSLFIIFYLNIVKILVKIKHIFDKKIN